MNVTIPTPATHEPAPRTVKASARRRVFVLIDALGWEFIKNRQFLNRELAFRRPLETVLGFSSGAIPTILTGLQPAQTGHWNLFYYDPAGSPFQWLRWFRFLPERALDNRVSRKIVKELGRRALGMGPLFECCVSPALLPFFNWVEKRNIYGEGGIPGSTSIFDLLRERGISYRVYSYHHSTDAEIVEQARREIRSGEAEFFFLYLSEMDNFLHHHCKDEQAVSEKLAWYERQLRDVLEAARAEDAEATFTIISDHGMTPVRSHYDLLSKIEALPLRMPQDYLSVYDSTMARFWFFSDTARRSITDELNRTPCGKILDDAELKRLGILFPDRRFGEVIFLLEPGCLFAKSDFNGRGWNPIGMHGYHPSDPFSDAIFLSNKDPRRQMTHIADIYPCLEEASSR